MDLEPKRAMQYNTMFLNTNVNQPRNIGNPSNMLMFLTPVGML